MYFEFFFYLTAKIQSGKTAINGTVQQLGLWGAVGCEQRNVDTTVDKTGFQVFQVVFVIAVIPIFVFALYHNDRSAIGAQQRQNFLAQAVKIAVEARDVLRIHAADLHIVAALDPPG